MPLQQPLRIGPVSIAGRVFLAPMSGITDAPFRRIACAHGAPAVVCEMIASGELAHLKPDTLRRAMDHDGAGATPLIIQLAGREPAAMAEAARIAAGLGADIIDINMGCPAKKVTGGLSGAALMREPDRALSLVDAVIGAVDVPVTVKMRLGWDDATRNAPQLAARVEAAGAAMITIHGRTRCQFYDGRADWPAIGEVKRAVGVPVIANGDLVTPGDAARMLAVTGADGVMIGRGAQGRPWFPGQVAAFLRGRLVQSDPPPAREFGIVRGHYESMLHHYGRDQGMRCARKHLGWTIARHAHSPQAERAWRHRLFGEDEPARVVGHLREFYDRLPDRLAA